MIYFDAAATSLQKPPTVPRACLEAMRTMASPGRGDHTVSARAAETLFSCRQEAAALLDMDDPERVILTFHATHGLNIAVHSLVKPGSRVLLSGYEHNAVMRPLASIPEVQIRMVQAPIFQPDIWLEELKAALRSRVDVFICTHVSNVFGYRLPLEEAADLCRQRGIPLLVDASQSAGVLPLSMEKLHPAFLACPGHKALYGPQGTGLLLCGETAVTPIMLGGTGGDSRRQEMPEYLPDRLEAGTYNIPGIAGLIEGIGFVRGKGTEAILRHEVKLKTLLVEEMKRIPGIEFFSGDTCQTGVVSFRSNHIDCSRLGDALGKGGVAVRSGLHCAPAAHQTVGTDNTGTVRLSVSVFNTEREAETFLRLLRKLVG